VWIFEEVLRPADSGQRTSRLRETLEEGMIRIITAVNDKKDQIPPITSTAVLPFPFDISISTCEY
jgi:hypothetical protein